MAEYRPSQPFTTALIVLKPTGVEKVAGVATKVFPAIKDGFVINASFRSYGGTQATINGLYSIVDTVDVETWYRPDITSDCEVVVAETGARYAIINEPEDINFRHQFMKFKLERAKGKV